MFKKLLQLPLKLNRLNSKEACNCCRMFDIDSTTGTWLSCNVLEREIGTSECLKFCDKLGLQRDHFSNRPT